MSNQEQSRTEQMQHITKGIEELQSLPERDAQAEALAKTLDNLIPELREASTNIRKRLSLDAQGITDDELAASVATRQESFDRVLNEMRRVIQMMEEQRKENSPHL